MPTITFSLTDEDVERIAKRLAVKLTDTLKQVPSPAEPHSKTQKLPILKSPPPEWLTSKDIQRMYQVSRTTVWRWANEQGMPYRRVGGVVRYPLAKVQAWAETRSIAVPTTGGTMAG